MTYVRVRQSEINPNMKVVECWLSVPGVWQWYALLKPNDDPAPFLRVICPQGWTFEAPPEPPAGA